MFNKLLLNLCVPNTSPGTVGINKMSFNTIKIDTENKNITSTLDGRWTQERRFLINYTEDIKMFFIMSILIPVPETCISGN